MYVNYLCLSGRRRNVRGQARLPPCTPAAPHRRRHRCCCRHCRRCCRRCRRHRPLISAAAADCRRSFLLHTLPLLHTLLLLHGEWTAHKWHHMRITCRDTRPAAPIQSPRRLLPLLYTLYFIDPVRLAVCPYFPPSTQTSNSQLGSRRVRTAARAPARRSARCYLRAHRCVRSRKIDRSTGGLRGPGQWLWSLRSRTTARLQLRSQRAFACRVRFHREGACFGRHASLQMPSAGRLTAGKQLR